jgi:enoyl-CoA hydratase/carnithine racemase
MILKFEPVKVLIDGRPAAHNACAYAMHFELNQPFLAMREKANRRAAILAANGPSFSAGRDFDVFLDDQESAAARIAGLTSTAAHPTKRALNQLLLDCLEEIFEQALVAEMETIESDGVAEAVTASLAAKTRIPRPKICRQKD